jgi:hypothetical protein
MVKITVCDDNDEEECIVVCASADLKTLFTDNVFENCFDCGCRIQHRPNVPKGKRICIECMAISLEGQKEPEIKVTQETMDLIRKRNVH